MWSIDSKLSLHVDAAGCTICCKNSINACTTWCKRINLPPGSPMWSFTCNAFCRQVFSKGKSTVWANNNLISDKMPVLGHHSHGPDAGNVAIVMKKCWSNDLLPSCQVGKNNHFWPSQTHNTHICREYILPAGQKSSCMHCAWLEQASCSVSPRFSLEFGHRGLLTARPGAK